MSVRPKDRWDFIETTLHSFRWTLCRFRDDCLVLGDQTLCLYGVRKGGRATINEAWARHGIGIGWGDVGRVTVALTRRLGLLLSPTGSGLLRPGARKIPRHLAGNQSGELVAPYRQATLNRWSASSARCQDRLAAMPPRSAGFAGAERQCAVVPQGPAGRRQPGSARR